MCTRCAACAEGFAFLRVRSSDLLLFSVGGLQLVLWQIIVDPCARFLAQVGAVVACFFYCILFFPQICTIVLRIAFLPRCMFWLGDVVLFGHHIVLSCAGKCHAGCSCLVLGFHPRMSLQHVLAVDCFWFAVSALRGSAAMSAKHVRVGRPILLNSYIAQNVCQVHRRHGSFVRLAFIAHALATAGAMTMPCTAIGSQLR